MTTKDNRLFQSLQIHFLSFIAHLKVLNISFNYIQSDLLKFKIFKLNANQKKEAKNTLEKKIQKKLK